MKLKYDFLVIGSGIAGLNFAIHAAEYGRVAVITKKELMESNSNYAQGGIAAVLDKHDSTTKHIRDTIKAGAGINNKKAVEVMVKEAPKQIQALIDLGVGFNKTKGKLDLTKEGGHSARRIVHAKDATGKEIERALLYNIRHNKNITTFESHIAIDLIVAKKICQGALVLDKEKNIIDTFYSKATILATGGAAQIYKRNCNPSIATGDGIAMAYRVGAKIQDIEFFQFHPTALNLKNKPVFLISETVRGEGGVLKNESGQAFMKKYHKQKDLAPRDIVTRAIFKEMKKGQVYIDIKKKGSKYLKKRFPYIYDQLWWYNIKMEKDLIPIAPAAHYICGGVHTNINGKTNIDGLYAFGEVAHTGVHGANRLASNSLLECMVFSSRALSSAKKYVKNKKYNTKNTTPKITIYKKIDPQINILKNNIKSLMWNNVGISRNTEKMKIALDRLYNIQAKIDKLYKKGINSQIIELNNINTVSILITVAAINRKKSIGCHFLAKT